MRSPQQAQWRCARGCGRDISVFLLVLARPSLPRHTQTHAPQTATVLTQAHARRARARSLPLPHCTRAQAHTHSPPRLHVPSPLTVHAPPSPRPPCTPPLLDQVVTICASRENLEFRSSATELSALFTPASRPAEVKQEQEGFAWVAPKRGTQEEGWGACPPPHSHSTRSAVASRQRTRPPRLSAGGLRAFGATGGTPAAYPFRRIHPLHPTHPPP
eukprot:scaffold12952_cov87-Isochrysis_galbana.AAC.1